MKILLADDRVIREGLRSVLEKGDGLEVVGEAATVHEAIASALRLKPDIAIVDISMPELDGIDAIGRLIEARPNMKIIALSMNADRRYVIAMFRAGAMGYLLKNSASDELLQAVRIVDRNQRYVSPSIAGLLVDGLVKRGRANEREREQPGTSAKLDRPLSSREREVLQLLAEGKSSKEIATHLTLALPTVETHRRQIMNKLNIRTIAELTKYAIREGLTSVD